MSGSSFRFSWAMSMFLVVLAGCGAGANSNVPSATAGIASGVSKSNGNGHCGQAAHKGSGSLIYTAQLYGHDLKVYSDNGSGLHYDCSLTQGVEDPNGSMTTTNGWWYVANGGGENVLVYRTKRNSPVGPVSSLSDYAEYPTNVALNPSRQLVAVSNLDTIPSGAGGSVAIYLHRQAIATRTLTYGQSGQYYGAGVAVSRNGDCYWAINGGTTNTGVVVRYDSCNGSPTIVASGIPKVGGLALDQSGNVYYVNSLASNGTVAGIFRCEASRCGVFASDPFVAPSNMNFDYRGKNLWVADPGAGYIDEISAKDGSLEYQFATGTSDPAFGIAPEPG